MPPVATRHPLHLLLSRPPRGRYLLLGSSPPPTPSARHADSVVAQADAQIHVYIRGKVAMSLFVGVNTAISLGALGVDLWLVFGLLAFWLNVSGRAVEAPRTRRIAWHTRTCTCTCPCHVRHMHVPRAPHARGTCATCTSHVRHMARATCATCHVPTRNSMCVCVCVCACACRVHACAVYPQCRHRPRRRPTHATRRPRDAVQPHADSARFRPPTLGARPCRERLGAGAIWCHSQAASRDRPALPVAVGDGVGHHRQCVTRDRTRYLAIATLPSTPCRPPALSFANVP